MRCSPLWLTVLLAIASPALAWHQEGHRLAASAAVAILPDTVPAFFRDGADAVARAAVEPDFLKDSSTPQLKSTEEPEHFIDLEYMNGLVLPATKYEFIALCQQHNLDPHTVGTLPYSIVEWTQRLTLAFAQYRNHPDDATLRAECLIYAGVLAHYAADSQQPLHTTVDHDGRAKPDGSSSHTGIHAKVDALPGTTPPKLEAVVSGLSPKALEPLAPKVLEAIQSSHALIDKVYELEHVLPAARSGPEGLRDQGVIDFTTERMRASASLCADLFLTAWENSAKVKVPDWVDH